MANAIKRQNVATLRSLAATEGYANKVNSQLLLHEVIRQAEDQGETPRLVEIFEILAGIPGVDINLRRDPPDSASGMYMATGVYGTPLELALSKGLPKIAAWLAKHLGYSTNDILPRVDITLFQWSIFRNKPELFFELLPEANIELQNKNSIVNALYLAIKSFNPIFIEEILKRVNFARMDLDNLFVEHPVATALAAKKVEIAKEILRHPTMSLESINTLIRRAKTVHWYKPLRDEIVKLAENEIEARPLRVSAKAFGEVLYRKGAEPGLGPLVGSYMGLAKKNRRTRRTRRTRKTARSSR